MMHSYGWLYFLQVDKSPSDRPPANFLQVTALILRNGSGANVLQFITRFDKWIQEMDFLPRIDGENRNYIHKYLPMITYL
jgi:hypothetical protein